MMRIRDIEQGLKEIERSRERIARMQDPEAHYLEWDKHLARLQVAYNLELAKALERGEEREQETAEDWWDQIHTLMI